LCSFHPFAGAAGKNSPLRRGFASVERRLLVHAFLLTAFWREYNGGVGVAVLGLDNCVAPGGIGFPQSG
jgi:hypothetical protein